MKRVTIKDIAKASGYSANCVSRALMDADDISAATKEKIRELANQMGYIPNAGAASLRSGKSNTIGIVCDNMVNPFYTIMMEYIREVFAEEKFRFITFYASSATCTDEEIRQAVSANVVGLISFLALDEEAQQLVNSLHLPLVVLGRRVQGQDCYVIDNCTGGARAAEYLVGQGLKKLCYLGDLPTVDCSVERGQGYREFLQSRGLQVNEFYLTVGAAPEDMIRHMLEEIGVPEGVFCFSDVLAYQLLDELNNRGVSGVRVVGFDNLYDEMRYCARIPTVGYNKKNMSNAAARRLIDRIRGTAGEPVVYVENIYLEST